MATKKELLKEAKDKGAEVSESATNAEIQAAIDTLKSSPVAVTPESTLEEQNKEMTPEEKEKAEAAKKATEEALKKEEEEAQAAIEEQKRLEEEAKNPPKKSEGSEIASAIREGLKEGKEDKRIKITADKSVKSMFSVVKNKQTGEVMIRENATGVLSKVQLKSLEEKEADLQKQEVEEI